MNRLGELRRPRRLSNIAAGLRPLQLWLPRATIRTLRAEAVLRNISVSALVLERLEAAEEGPHAA